VISFSSIIGALIVITAGILLLVFTFQYKKAGDLPHSLRSIPAFDRLQRALGLSVENGKRLHVALGNSNLVSQNSPAGLIGLRTLERVAQLSIISDHPPVVTSGDGALSILSQDTLRAAYQEGNVQEQYDPDRGRLAGVSPLSYVAGALPETRGSEVSAHLIVGNYGPEVALLTEAAEREKTFTLAASDSIPGQAALFATAQESLIGEEMYAMPAYLSAGPAHTASLKTQDILRWVILAVTFITAVLRLLGVQIL